jgi:hypothetical protein
MKITLIGLLLFLSSCFPKKTNKQEEAEIVKPEVEIVQEEVEIAIEFARSSKCDFSGYPYEQKAGQVKEFIKLVSDIINAKPEVKNSSESDVMYM